MMWIEKLVVAAIILLILFGVANLFGGIVVKDEVAIRCLEIQGYSHIQVLDKAWFAIPIRGGDRGDAARFHMRATNPTGQQVEVYVFSGWLFKGATIRTM